MSLLCFSLSFFVLLTKERPCGAGQMATQECFKPLEQETMMTVGEIMPKAWRVCSSARASMNQPPKLNKRKTKANSYEHGLRVQRMVREGDFKMLGSRHFLQLECHQWYLSSPQGTGRKLGPKEDDVVSFLKSVSSSPVQLAGCQEKGGSCS